MRRPLIAGNWKLNKTHREGASFVREFIPKVAGLAAADIVLCPPFTALESVAEKALPAGIFVGAQDLFWEESGAYTGEVSGPQLSALGCTHVIVGHSERRSLFGDTDEWVGKKTRAAFAAGLLPILCVGETLEEREDGRLREVLVRQVSAVLEYLGRDQVEKLIIAYEPVWAIGTGKSASGDDADEAAEIIREVVGPGSEKVRVLYGGSVKPANIADFTGRPGIDGALVGGASLDAATFASVVRGAVKIE